MGIMLKELESRVRGELGNVTKAQLPSSSILSYTNTTQNNIALVMGPVLEPFLRARISLAAAASGVIENTVLGSGSYDHTGGATYEREVVTFLGLGTSDTYVGKEIILTGEFLSGDFVYRDIIQAHNDTKVQISGNCGLIEDSVGISAFIVTTPTAVDAGLAGFTLPSDCLKPLYLADNTTPSSESRIDFIQTDDTEIYLTDTFRDAEMRAALQVGNTVQLFKGSSASFPATLVLTYVRRPVAFANDTDQLRSSDGRLPEDYADILQDGIIQRAARYLKRTDEMNVAGNLMESKMQSIRDGWSLGQAVDREEKATRS